MTRYVCPHCKRPTNATLPIPESDRSTTRVHVCPECYVALREEAQREEAQRRRTPDREATR